MATVQDGVAVAGFDPAAVRDTIAQVFAHPGYDESLRQSLGDRILEWIFRTVGAALTAIRGSADIRWIIIGLAALLLITVAARVIFLAGVNARRRQSSFRRAASTARDPWQAAEKEAAAARYTEAAHLLYAAVLETIGARHRILLHPAKTAGEYQRELSVRSPDVVPAFRAFIRAYEPIVWRARGCTEGEYHRLHALAEDVARGIQQRAAA